MQSDMDTPICVLLFWIKLYIGKKNDQLNPIVCLFFY